MMPLPQHLQSSSLLPQCLTSKVCSIFSVESYLLVLVGNQQGCKELYDFGGFWDLCDQLPEIDYTIFLMKSAWIMIVIAFIDILFIPVIFSCDVRP